MMVVAQVLGKSYPNCVKIELVIVWSIIYCMVSEGVAITCFQNMLYLQQEVLAAFYNSSLASTLGAQFICLDSSSVSTTSGGHLTQGLEETHVLFMWPPEWWEDVPGHPKGYQLPLWGYLHGPYPAQWVPSEMLSVFQMCVGQTHPKERCAVL